MSGDFYAIGDIHGNLDLLKRLLDQLQPDLHRDRLIFMGDYIDRGPRLPGGGGLCFKPADQLSGREDHLSPGQPRSHVPRFPGRQEPEFFLLNGGRSTLADYWGEDWEEQPDWCCPWTTSAFTRSYCLYYATEDYIFVHGGLKARGASGGQQAEEDLFWIRGEFHRVHGGFWPPGNFRPHALSTTPDDPQQDRHRYRGGVRQWLTCLKLPQMDFILWATTTSFG